MDEILQRFLDMEKSGAEYYFDADEIVELLDYFEDEDDFDRYTKMIGIGKKFHPDNHDIQIHICKSHMLDNQYEIALEMIERLDDMEDDEVRLLRCECYCELDRIEDLKLYLKDLGDRSDRDMWVVEETFSGLTHLLRDKYDNKYAYELVCYGAELYPESVLLVEEMCVHLEDQGRIDEAIEILKGLTNDHPYCSEYWHTLARLYCIAKDYDKAIETFDFALVCEGSDIETKLLRAFCYFVKGDFLKILEIYIDVLCEDSFFIAEWGRLNLYFPDEYDRAYVMLKLIINKFDNSTNISWRYIKYFDKDDAITNGVLSIAEFFPHCLLFLLCKEFLLIIEGNMESIDNVDQILHLIYQTGISKKNICFDTTSKFYTSPHQKVATMLSEKTIDIEGDFRGWRDARQILKYLLDGNISMYCEKYLQIEPGELIGFLESFLPLNKRPLRATSVYLLSNEINRNKDESLSIKEISSIINNKTHLN